MADDNMKPHPPRHSQAPSQPAPSQALHPPQTQWTGLSFPSTLVPLEKQVQARRTALGGLCITWLGLEDRRKLEAMESLGDWLENLAYDLALLIRALPTTTKAWTNILADMYIHLDILLPATIQYDNGQLDFLLPPHQRVLPVEQKFHACRHQLGRLLLCMRQVPSLLPHSASYAPIPRPAGSLPVPGWTMPEGWWSEYEHLPGTYALTLLGWDWEHVGLLCMAMTGVRVGIPDYWPLRSAFDLGVYIWAVAYTFRASVNVAPVEDATWAPEQWSYYLDNFVVDQLDTLLPRMRGPWQEQIAPDLHPETYSRQLREVFMTLCVACKCPPTAPYPRTVQ